MNLRSRWRLFAVTAVAAGSLAGGGSAWAASPTQIYKDLADNGRLDGHYSKSEVNAALKDAVLQGYGDQNVQSGLQGTAPANEAAGGVAATTHSGALPFTGTDLGLMVAGGGVLLLLGFGLRRFARNAS
ncbi:MAG: hypothetical protein ACJ747_06745 [Gaiellaceae bacterium]|jgi:hypothetical protein|nr:hypothetical protein [Acidobacteriota bacterium]